MFQHLFVNILFLFFAFKSVTSASCGIQKVGRGLIIGGSYSSPGAWPWFGALKLKKDNKFFCGGTLFTERHMLTAAHCIQFKHYSKNLKAEDIVVNLGTYDLNDSHDPNVVIRDIQELIVHPEWSKVDDSYHADITLLYLSSKVDFTDFIQPICLPLNNGAGILDEGTIVGYGKSTKSGLSVFDHEYIPKQVNIVAISNELCFLDKPDLARLSSKYTYCAGGRNVGACTGDSGGGFYVLSGRNYALRGIISSSLLDANNRCDVSHYAVYTDVSKFLDWITESVNRTSKNQRVQFIAIEVKQWILQSLECFYTKSELKYACDVLLLNFNDDNIKIESTNGDHIGDRTNFDVNHFRAYSKSTIFLPHGIGEIFPNLESMYVGRCSVEYIERAIFTRMKNLKELTMTWNQVSEIPEDTFWDLVSLENLNIGGNNVRHLNKKLLINLINLKSFNAHDNRIERIDADMFLNNQKIEIISFSNCLLKIIKSTFELQKLSYLNLNTGCAGKQFPLTVDSLEEMNKIIIENCRRIILSNLEGTKVWNDRFGNSTMTM